MTASTVVSLAKACVAITMTFVLCSGATAADALVEKQPPKPFVSKVGGNNAVIPPTGSPAGKSQPGKPPSMIKFGDVTTDIKQTGQKRPGAAGVSKAIVKWEGPDLDAAKKAPAGGAGFNPKKESRGR